MLGSSNTYKVVLVGSKGTGKTGLIRSHLGMDITHYTYKATVGVEVHPLRFPTKDGHGVCFNVWDIAGDRRFAGLSSGYYVEADAVIVIENDKDKARKWKGHMRSKLGGDVPIVVVDDFDLGTLTPDKAMAPFLILGTMLGHTIDYY